MKISGYGEKRLVGGEEFVDLEEITMVATPEECRRISTFLLGAADAMERMGEAYSHIHLADKQPGFEDSPHFTVFKPRG